MENWVRLQKQIPVNNTMTNTVGALLENTDGAFFIIVFFIMVVSGCVYLHVTSQPLFVSVIALFVFIFTFLLCLLFALLVSAPTNIHNQP